MSTFPRYHQDIVDNPVQRHEREHIRRERISWFSRGLYIITIFAIIYPMFIGMIEAIFSAGSVRNSFEYVLRDSFLFLVLLNGLAIFIFEMRIIGDSADSMRREFQGKTWDLLILTGVDTWRLIVGKWLGVIRGHRRNIIYLYVLRVSTFAWGMAVHYLAEDGFYYWRFDRPDATFFDIRFDLSIFVGVAVLMAVYLALEIMLVAALPMALSMFKPSRKGATWLALGLRAVVPVAFMLLVIFIRDLPYILNFVNRWEYRIPDITRIATDSIAIVLADNGFFLAVSQLGYFNHGDVFTMVHILGIGLYLLWIWIMLVLAKWMAHRMTVSAPGFEPKIKTKHPAHTKVKMAVTANEIPQALPVRTVPKIQTYRCEVAQYDRERHQLVIAVYAQGETVPTQTIRFDGVNYFTGMLRWRTTDYSVVQDNKLESFSNQQHIDYDRLSGASKLYEMQSMDSPVYIIATDMQEGK